MNGAGDEPGQGLPGASDPGLTVGEQQVVKGEALVEDGPDAEIGMATRTRLVTTRDPPFSQAPRKPASAMLSTTTSPQASKHSNTARAHELGRTRDWVVIYWEQDGHEDQCTVVTEYQGALAGQRVVRGREAECAEAAGP